LFFGLVYDHARHRPPVLFLLRRIDTMRGCVDGQAVYQALNREVL
jgi:hypothetical protein